MLLDNIREVVEQGLCTGCGTCCGICPVEAVEMHVSKGLLLPETDEEKCTGCGLCVKCCPGYAVDFEALNSAIFGAQPKDAFLGNYLGCYVGHSNDYEVRFNSSSGGLVTQLLLFALDNGLIDGAVVTRMRKANPLLPESFIARTREEIISASKSKYCPTSTNEILKQILKEDGKFAFVGLPCQIHGVRKAEMNIKGLREKIVLHIGLFCSHTVNFDGTYFLLAKLGVNWKNVAELNYRGCGWPGSMFVRLKNGRSLNVQFVRGWNAYWNIFSPFFFTPLRCLMCSDLFNELADVSVGDAWLPEFKHENPGESVIVSRTKIGEEILASMERGSKLSLIKVHSSKVKQSQAFSLNFKKENLSRRLMLLTMFGKRTPKINSVQSSSFFWGFLGAFLAYLSFLFSSKRSFRKFLFYVPLPVFRLYFGLFKCIYLISCGGQF